MILKKLKLNSSKDEINIFNLWYENHEKMEHEKDLSKDLTSNEKNQDSSKIELM